MRKRIKCVVCGRIFASYEKYDEHSYQAHRLRVTTQKRHYELIDRNAIRMISSEI
ncbi:MAG: hypothetical protein QXJ68_07250 [Methanocellales archaeon]